MPRHHLRHGFTLIELLTVVAVIGILAAILIPTVGRLQTGAKKTVTRAMFSQVIGAVELFRTEYGYFPNFNDTTGSGGTDYAPNANFGKINFSRESTEKFFQALTGRNIAGQTTGFNPNLAGNTRFIRFLTVTTEMFDGSNALLPRIRDGFGNTDIALFMDTAIPAGNDPQVAAQNRPNDGIIFIPLIGVRGGVGGTTPEVFPSEIADPGVGNVNRQVRASVIMYSAGEAGGTQDIIKSWGP